MLSRYPHAGNLWVPLRRKVPPLHQRLTITVPPADLVTRQWLADLGAWWGGGDRWLLHLPTDTTGAQALTEELDARGLTWKNESPGGQP